MARDETIQQLIDLMRSYQVRLLQFVHLENPTDEQIAAHQVLLAEVEAFATKCETAFRKMTEACPPDMMGDMRRGERT